MSYHPHNQSQENPERRRRQHGFAGWKIRLLIAGAIVVFAAISHFSSGTKNPVTGETQRVGGMTPEQEMQIGRSAASQMVMQHGGLSRERRAARHVQMVGKRLESVLYQKLLQEGKRLPYALDFHLLADRRVVNAFALPGGQVFLTEALYGRMTDEGQLAGVLGHEVGHVIERHGAERMAKSSFFQRIAGAAGVAGGDITSAQAANAALNVVSLGYGRTAELEADRWGIELMVMAGYNPNHMLEVMDILKEASAGGEPPEFLSSHPRPENRKEYIAEVIDHTFPEGLPPGLR